jgi:hypothetical protein
MEVDSRRFRAIVDGFSMIVCLFLWTTCLGNKGLELLCDVSLEPYIYDGRGNRSTGQIQWRCLPITSKFEIVRYCTRKKVEALGNQMTGDRVRHTSFRINAKIYQIHRHTSDCLQL